ncbi:hypothetical protein IHE44_0004436 [Lamprotornis superbus]|uniref:Uncharacterized protein n=1 Tax=Lamprotornis superbus TaxID=245042 RepID=A0A835NG62_9PASS|nr:hypothetical protein IHE44_0004436 [Lamprotornis superbus]
MEGGTWDAVPDIHKGGAGPVPAAGPVAMFLSPHRWHWSCLLGFLPPSHPSCPLHQSYQHSALFNKAAIGPLLMGADHELSSDVLQWWLGSSTGVHLQAIILQFFNVLWAPTAKTCEVVGNSGWLKRSSHGLLIDAHDWVLRVTCCPCLVGPRAWDQQTMYFVLGHTILLSFKMNRAKVTGFELDVGMRTTHHFMYPESAVKLRPNVHLVLILSPALLKYIHDNWTQHHGWYPSTGFTALLFALHTCQQHTLLLACAQVCTFGFRADSEGNWHHYWEKTCWSRAFRRTRVHDTDVEFSLIKRWAHEGRIISYK